VRAVKPYAASRLTPAGSNALFTKNCAVLSRVTSTSSASQRVPSAARVRSRTETAKVTFGCRRPFCFLAIDIASRDRRECIYVYVVIGRNCTSYTTVINVPENRRSQATVKAFLFSNRFFWVFLQECERLRNSLFVFRSQRFR